MDNPYAPSAVAPLKTVPRMGTIAACYFLLITFCAAFAPAYFLTKGFGVSLVAAVAVAFVSGAMCFAALFTARRAISNSIAAVLLLVAVVFAVGISSIASARHEKDLKFDRAVQRIKKAQLEKQKLRDVPTESQTD